MKFEKLQPGMTVYKVGRMRMGNTTLMTTGVWPILILSIDKEKRCVVASWNTNPPRAYHERTISKWRIKRPLLIRTAMGTQRLATREEQKLHTQQGNNQ